MPYSSHTASVLVTSDTCSKDPSKDTSGQYVLKELEKLNFAKVTKYIVEDNKEEITVQLKSILNNYDKNVLIITVGGTGLCPRDVTPEATSALYDKQCYGIATALTMSSLRYSAHAALSRLTAGVSGQCLIVNFPGKLKACKECFASLNGFLSHAIEQVRFDQKAIEITHSLVQDETDEPVISNSVSPPPPEKQQPTSSRSSEITTVSEYLEKLKPNSSRATSETSSEITSTTEVSHSKQAPSLESPFALIEYNDALRIMNNVTVDYRTKETEIGLDKPEIAQTLLGTTLAEDVHSKVIIPPYSVSTMDGYVVHVPKGLGRFINNIGMIQATLLADRQEFEKLRQDPQHSANALCYQVNTGCRVPSDNCVVVPFEDTGNKSANKIPIAKLTQNNYVREQGSDLNYSYVMKAGTVVGPVQLALLLSMGHDSVKVLKRPTIGILSTGDELVESYKGRIDDITKVIDTNGPLLTSFFRSRGYQALNFGLSKDARPELSLKILASLGECNILVITGGASMGTKDYVKDVIQEIGGTIHFGTVNIKPGKPVAFASLVKDDETKFLFALPGNPVSAYVTSLVLVIPFIERISKKTLPSIGVLGDLITVKIADVSKVNESYEFDGRFEFIRARLIDGQEPNMVEVQHSQQSSCMQSLENCNCLLLIEPSMKGKKLTIGESYRALVLKK